MFIFSLVLELDREHVKTHCRPNNVLTRISDPFYIFAESAIKRKRVGMKCVKVSTHFDTLTARTKKPFFIKHNERA